MMGELTDDIDGDGVEDDDPTGDRCPVCNQSQQDGNCGHLLIALNEEMRPIGGVLYEEWKAILNSAQRMVFNALVGRVGTGGCEGLDQLKQDIATEFDWRDHVSEPEDVDADHDPEEAYPFFEDAWHDWQWDQRVSQILESELESIPAVISTHYEFSSAPSMTWSGYDHWASDPEDAVNEFRAQVQAWSRQLSEP